ncbi:complement C1q tumor necrosis factor-related protein 3-like [Mytilus edulis]|uniref:complement C1q tumor necrosis factor-related protein 3-like n=1 Tax=Mytilus edulis TaxID=6550 RepID=UPI0039EE136C
MQFWKVLVVISLMSRVESEGEKTQLQSSRSLSSNHDNPVLWMLMKQVDRLKTKLSQYDEKIEKCAKQDKNGLIHETQVAFHARLAKSVTLHGAQTVIFDKDITNIGNAYNPHTGLFKAPYAGLYFFSCTFLKQRSTFLRVQMMKNNIEVQLGYANKESKSDAGSMIAVVYLKTGDIVKVRHHPTFGPETMHGHWSFFTGYLI